MWKEKCWSPVVRKFSSNWKELSTLKLTLLNLHQEAEEEAAGATVFCLPTTLLPVELCRRDHRLCPAFML
jgi:hypothetical protein